MLFLEKQLFTRPLQRVFKNQYSLASCCEPLASIRPSTKSWPSVWIQVYPSVMLPALPPHELFQLMTSARRKPSFLTVLPTGTGWSVPVLMQLSLLPARSCCPHLCWLCACPCPWSRRCSSAAGSGSPGTRTGPWQTCAHRPRGRTSRRCWQSSASRPCQAACRKSTCALLGREGIRNADCKSQLWCIDIVQTNSDANRLWALQDSSHPTVVTVIYSNIGVAAHIKISYSK